MENSICGAIEGRKLLRFTYDGGERTVAPYVYGTTRAGIELLRGYQVAGFSQSGKSDGWKLFRVAEITGLIVTEESFASIRPEDYRGTDPTIASVYCQVE